MCWYSLSCFRRKETMKKYPKIQKPEEFIEACKALINNYELNFYPVAPCPLCRIAVIITNNPGRPCSVCPWRVFKWKKRNNCYYAFNGATREESIRRLQFWIKIMEKQIKDEQQKTRRRNHEIPQRISTQTLCLAM